METEVEREKSCEERIDGHLESRMKDFRAMLLLRRCTYEEFTVQEISDALDRHGLDWKEYTELLEHPVPWMALRELNLNEVEEVGFALESEYPLCVSKQNGSLKIEISWGGPQDYFMLHGTEATYHFLDWFDGATRLLSANDFEVLEDLYGELRCILKEDCC